MNSPPPETPQEELDRAREAFREFVFHAIHDLRQPLRAVSTSSEMLAGICGDTTDVRATECLRYIREGAERMSTLLHDITAYFDGDGRELYVASVNLSDALAQAQLQLREELQKNEAVLTQDPLPTVRADFLAVVMVFRHLIENACKFRGAEAPHIHVGSAQRDGEWVLSVRDNGSGFKPDYAQAIFQPFKRLHGKEYPGNGLGLALVERLLDRQGGRIWAESTPGRGSVFSFSLPVS
jgi:light-regulated signal transduction histidine kinase (bacteriophytochrome)